MKYCFTFLNLSNRIVIVLVTNISVQKENSMKNIFKTVAVTALSVMLLASCTTVENVYTPLDGKAPSTDLTAVKQTTVDLDSPYHAIHYGLFHNQKSACDSYPGPEGTPVERITEGTYSIFIPQNSQPKVPTTIVLVPNGMTAEEFTETEDGKWWIAEAANEGAFAVVFAEPENGAWNTTLDDAARNEAAFIKDIFKTIRVKALTDNAYINVDKNSVSLAGYREGAEMAAYIAATYPTIISSTTLFAPTAFNRAQAEEILAQGAYVHPDNWSKAFGTMKNGEIGMPMNVIARDGSKEAAVAITEVWTAVNTAALAKAEDTVKDESLYSAHLYDDMTTVDAARLTTCNARVQGYAGGTLRIRPDYSQREWATFEGKLGTSDLVRRWRVYTPASYDAATPAPLVVCMHGSTSAITDIAEETRWSDLAEEEGIIVVYIQGYLTGKNLPKPGWALMNTDVATNPDLQFIENVVAWMQEYRTIDTSRMYLTGHSLGSMMTQTAMSSPINTLFAAYAPIGMFFNPFVIPSVNDTVTPVWAMNGEFDMQVPEGKGGAYESGMLWAQNIGIDVTADPEAVSQPGFNEGKFMTKTWEKAGVPLVQVTGVMDSPHVYMAEQAQMIWDWFSCFTRNQETGELRYNDTVVTEAK